MNFISQLFFAVIISSITGTLLLLVWRFLRGLFMAVNPKLVNITLRIVCVIYMLPLGYVAILLSEHKWLDGREQGWKLFFARTKWLTGQIQLLSLAWFVLACGLILLRIVQNKIWCKKLEDNIPMEEGELAEEVFGRVCRKMGIPKESVSLQHNPLMVSPMIVRPFHPQIVLPEQEYSEEELELIFYHELSHYKHHDLKWKVAIVILTMAQCFNLAIYPLLSIISFWSECMADLSALECSGNIRHARQYFEKIEKLIPEPEGKKKDKYLFAALYRDGNVMVRRVDFVQCYQHACLCSRRVSAVVLGGFVLAAVLFEAVAGISVAELHKFVYKATADNTAIQEDGMEEHYVYGRKWLFHEQTGGLLPAENGAPEVRKYYHMECAVEPGVCQASRGFLVQAGQSINVNTTVQCYGMDYWVGIQDEDGYVRYVIGNGAVAVSYNFSITKTGRYCVCVKNNSTGETIPDVSVTFILDSL